MVKIEIINRLERTTSFNCWTYYLNFIYNLDTLNNLYLLNIIPKYLMINIIFKIFNIETNFLFYSVFNQFSTFIYDLNQE